MIKKLRVYQGPEHEHAAQDPKVMDVKPVAAPKNVEQAHTVEEVQGG